MEEFQEADILWPETAGEYQDSGFIWLADHADGRRRIAGQRRKAASSPVDIPKAADRHCPLLIAFTNSIFNLNSVVPSGQFIPPHIFLARKINPKMVRVGHGKTVKERRRVIEYVKNL